MSMVPYLPHEELQALADQFLDRFHASRDVPVPIELLAERDMNFDLVPMPNLQSRFGVVAFLTWDLTEIRIDEQVFQRGESRLRFSIAHELAHVLLDHQRFLETPEDASQVSRQYDVLTEADYGRIEFQARELAGLILVPTIGLEQRFVDAMQGLGDEMALPERFEYAQRLLAHDYKVNMYTMHRRLEVEGLGVSRFNPFSG